VVSIARDTGLELAVRSGGHSLAGNSTTDGGIVLDLADMNALEIDPQDRTATTETGLTASAYSTAARAYGLATGFGDTGSVGIGGLTLGGGIGLPVRKHGLTIDDLPAAELVTADGQLLRVDDQTHPDLFWALRGGGGNFGVATRFRFRLHPIDQIVGGLLLPAPPDTIANVLPARCCRSCPPPTTAAWSSGHPRLRRRPGGGRARVVPGARHADLRPGPPHALPGDPPPEEEGSTRPRRCARCSSTPSTATRPQRSSSTLRPRPPRCWWPSAFAHRASRLMPRVWPMSWGLLGSQIGGQLHAP